MKLNIVTRATDKKSDAKKLRREGKIPAALYVKGKASLPIALVREEYDTMMRQIQKGTLSTKKITLVDEEGKERVVIVKDIHYDIITYLPIHFDFQQLFDDVKLKVNIPIECVGAVDCVGMKLGGVLRQVIRMLKVECFPQDMPESFKLDIRSLQIGESKKLKDLEIPSTVRALNNINEVAVAIAKR